MISEVAVTLAARLLGERAAELIGYHQGQPAHPILVAARTQVLCRSRLAEDVLRRSGAVQYIVLGAGLDTFAYRSAGIRVFEVDHPGMQRWKRAALAAAGIAEPPQVRFVPADLSAGALVPALTAAGFDQAAPAVVAWLGVSMYLDLAAIEATLAALAGLAPGSELVLDYMLPAGHRDKAGDLYVELIAAAAAEHGEPWQTFLTPDEMTALLTRHGFTRTEQLSQAGSIPAGLWQRTDALRPISLSMLAAARLG